MGEGLVGVEEAVAAGEQIALHHPHQGVLGEHLHHPAAAGELAAVHVLRQELLHPHLLAHLIDRLQAVGGGFIGAKHPQGVGVGGNAIAQQLAEGVGVLGLALARHGHGHGVGLHRRQVQLAAQQAAVGVGVGAHAQPALGREGPQMGLQCALLIEQLPGAVALQPGLQLLQLGRVVAGIGQGHLVGAPEVLDLLLTHRRRAGPALGGAQHDHRPGRPGGVAGVAAGPGLGPDRQDAADRRVHRLGHGGVHRHRLAALHEQRLPAVAAH